MLATISKAGRGPDIANLIRAQLAKKHPDGLLVTTSAFLRYLGWLKFVYLLLRSDH
jgi:hypothetical protein